MLFNLALAALAAKSAVAFPWVAGQDGVDSTLLRRGAKLEARQQPGTAAACPFNPNHTAAVPINAKYPYCGAIGGKPGKQSCPNNQVPAPGDTAHAWEAPGPKDIRGPCPGINTAANHHFLSHDGITNFTELIDMQQNVYGVGYDLASLLAVLGVGLDGDPLGTSKLSIGCDATSRTSSGSPGAELGLDGHNKFEGDTSLTRNDYFLANGDNFSFNKTLYSSMTNTCMGNFDRNNIALYRYNRYQQSLNTNGNFYFGPKSLLLYGAASFLYELFPSLGSGGAPDQPTMDSFFLKEQIPANWFSRSDPYSLSLVGQEIFSQYGLYPVAFGGNTGKPNSFVGVGALGPSFSAGSLMNATANGVVCLLYMLATENDPAQFGGGGVAVPTANLKWMAKQLNPIYAASSFGCPLAFNSD